MSVVTGGEPPTGRGAALAAPRPAVAPALADGVELIGEMEGSGYRTPPSLVRRGDGQVIQLTPLLFRVLSAVDGQRDPDEIAEVVSAASGRKVTAANVATLVQEQLLPLGFLRLADGTQPEVKKANPLLALRFRYAVTDPRSTRRITRPFAVLFQPLLVAVLLAAFVAVCGWVMFDKGLASATHQAFYAPGLLLLVFAVTVLSAGFHEFGHAAAARYGGATPGVMGMGLYLVWPAFYTDVTDSYRLGRGGRLRTDLGGLYFNAIVAVAIFGVWFVSHWDALLLVIVTQVLQMLRQLAPLVRFDGYHVLADLTGVPDLYHHIKPILLGLLPHHWGRPENKVLKPWVRVVVSTWVLLVVPLLLGLLALMVLAFPRLAATAWDSLGRQVDGFQSAVVEGNVTAMGAGILAMLAVALPLVGMVYIVTRLVRQVSASVWSSTEGRPARRGLAVLVALAIVVGLAWAWWPAEDRYRPVQAYERGTIADLLPTSQEAGLTEGTVARASTVWPADQPLPTAERPVLSVVLVPRDSGDASTADATEAIGDTAGAGTTDASGASGDGSVTTADPGTWVFPFDRPPAPVEGDNQALAVNTTDNSVVYDIAFALVWVEDGESSENVNSSYALASCTNCAAVSVAFQVVLVVGQSDTIVPQNLAAAVNYNCIECVTYALAQQLVLTVDGPLSDAAMTELVALWQEIAEFGRTITDVPLSEIQARLTEFESRIITIIERDQGSLLDRSNPSPSTSTSPSGSADPTATPTGSTGTSGGATGTDATGSDDSEPASGSSPAPTSGSTPSPTPTPDSEPTPSPEPTTSQPTPTPSPTTSAPSPTASP